MSKEHAAQAARRHQAVLFRRPLSSRGAEERSGPPVHTGELGSLPPFRGSMQLVAGGHRKPHAAELRPPLKSRSQEVAAVRCQHGGASKRGRRSSGNLTRLSARSNAEGRGAAPLSAAHRTPGGERPHIRTQQRRAVSRGGGYPEELKEHGPPQRSVQTEESPYPASVQSESCPWTQNSSPPLSPAHTRPL